ncbi:MAG: hypothetical protein U0X41_09300 [Chitinophagales bacterium]|jgi:hypothetical protein
MKYIKRIFHYFFQAPTHITPINKRALLLGVLLLILAGSRIYYNIYDYMDIVYGDEVIYMKTGLNITQDFNRDWGPLYCIWYKFISFFFHDTITLYYFNFVFVAILASLLIYAAFLAMDIHPLVAFYFALCFISSKAVVPMWPRISLFAISILMAGIIVVSRIRELYLRLLIFCLTLLLASYARPELYLSFILSVLIFITYYFAERIYQKKYSLYHLILFVLTSVLLHIIFRFPSNFYNGYPRNLAAFYQHYMVNMFYLNKATEYDWIYWKDAHKAIFTNSNSIFDIILHYPHEFFTHVGLNLKNYILEIFGKNICVIFPFLLGKNKLFLSGSLLVFAGSVSLLFNKHIRREFKVILQNHAFFLVMLAIWGIPTIISSIVIFPREHYIMLNYFLFIIPLCLLLTLITNRLKALRSLKYMAGLAMILIPLLSSAKNYQFFLTDQKKNNMCSRKALEHIKNKHLNEHVQYTFFADIHCFVGFLPNNIKEINTIFDKTKDVPFTAILEYHKPDFILVNNCINYSPSLINDAAWQDFIKNPYAYGYRYEFIKDCPYYYLVRNTVHDKE